MLGRLLLALAVAVVSASASGEELSPRQTVERIEVRGVERLSVQTVIDETLLEEGRAYSHSDIRDAVARLRRLPFFHRAGFAIEPGTAPDSVILIIIVEEMTRLSFFGDGRGIEYAPDRSRFDYAYGDPIADWRDGAAAFRWFSGRNVAHFGQTVDRNRSGFATNYSFWELGYTRHDLFGTAAFATVNVRVPVDSVAEGYFTPELIVGVPLSSRQTITLDVQDALFRDVTHRIGEETYRLFKGERNITLAWSYNTTDEVFTPSRGTYLSVAPVRTMKDQSSFTYRPPAFEPRTSHVNAKGVDLAALRYWPVSDRHTISAGLLGGWGSVEERQKSPSGNRDVEWDTSYQVVQTGLSRRLRSDARIGVDLRYFTRQRSEEVAGPWKNEHSFETEITWMRRTRWLTLRLGLGYATGDFESQL